MSQLYRHNTTGREIEIMCYLSDRSNQQKIMDWIDSRYQSPWPGTSHTSQAGGAYELIAFHFRNGDTVYIRPGDIVGVYSDDQTWAKLEEPTFLRYFSRVPNTPIISETTEKDTMPPAHMTEPGQYTKLSTNESTTAILYRYSLNTGSVEELLSHYGSVSSGASIYTGELIFYPDPLAIEIINAQSATASIAVPKDTWVTITARPGRRPLLCLYTDTRFSDTFRYGTPKEPTMPDAAPELVFTFDPDTEYGQKVTEILDVLAVLRVNPSNAHFELVTKELMAHLASAYNEGWDEGIAVAQTNPYEQWEN